MNIFVLARNPVTAAKFLCDKHVPKMVLETAQLLCSPYPDGDAPYRRTHYNHPCAKWVRTDSENYFWLCEYGAALSKEYTFRYGKKHKSQCVIEWAILHRPDGLPVDIFRLNPTPFAQAMPKTYQHRDPVHAYRAYYIGEKKRFAKWIRGRKPPGWWPKS